MITRLAAGRLIPKDPARVEISTHCTSVLVGSLNASTRSCLAFADVCPSSLCVAKNPKTTPTIISKHFSIYAMCKYRV